MTHRSCAKQERWVCLVVFSIAGMDILLRQIIAVKNWSESCVELLNPKKKVYHHVHADRMLIVFTV